MKYARFSAIFLLCIVLALAVFQTASATGGPVVTALKGPDTVPFLGENNEPLTFSVEVTGGSAPYTYRWIGQNAQVPVHEGPEASVQITPAQMRSVGVELMCVWVEVADADGAAAGWSDGSKQSNQFGIFYSRDLATGEIKSWTEPSFPYESADAGSGGSTVTPSAAPETENSTPDTGAPPEDDEENGVPPWVYGVGAVVVVAGGVAGGLMLRRGKGSDRGEQVQLPDGNQGIIRPDGTREVLLPDGTQGVMRPDGTLETYYPDGSSEVERPDGSRTEYGANGAWVSYNNRNEVTGIRYASGITGTINLNGNSVFKGPGGGELTISKDGAISGDLIMNDGAKWSIRPDGRERVEIPGQFTADYNPDGSMVLTDPSGSSMTINPDGSMEGKMTLDDGRTVTVEKNGGMQIENKTGDKLTVNPDGSGTFRSPDGTMDFRPDGSTGFDFKDGAKGTVSADGSVSLN